MHPSLSPHERSGAEGRISAPPQSFLAPCLSSAHPFGIFLSKTLILWLYINHSIYKGLVDKPKNGELMGFWKWLCKNIYSFFSDVELWVGTIIFVVGFVLSLESLERSVFRAMIVFIPLGFLIMAHGWYRMFEVKKGGE